MCLCKHSGQLLKPIMEMLGERATYLALMEATLGNYKLEKQAFIPLWKEFSFPNGLFKINIFLHIWEFPHRQGWQGCHCSQAPRVHVSLKRAISNPLPSYLGDSLCCLLRPDQSREAEGGWLFNIKSSSSQFVSFPAGSTCKRGGNTAMVGKQQLFQGLFSTQGSLWTVVTPKLFPTSPCAGLAAEVRGEQRPKESQWSPPPAIPMLHRPVLSTRRLHEPWLFIGGLELISDNHRK